VEELQIVIIVRQVTAAWLYNYIPFTTFCVGVEVHEGDISQDREDMVCH